MPRPRPSRPPDSSPSPTSSSSSNGAAAASSSRSPPGRLRQMLSGPNKQDHERMKRLAQSALEILQPLADIASGATSDAGIPGLSAGLAGLSKVLKKIQTMSTTLDGVDTLNERIKLLSKALVDFSSQKREQKLPEAMQLRINGLVREWRKIGKRAQRIKSSGRIRRFFKSDVDAQKMQELIVEVNASIQNFLLLGSLHVEETIHRVEEGVKELNTRLKTQLQESFMSSYARGARYDANGVRRPCFEGTQVQALSTIRTWVRKHTLDMTPQGGGQDPSRKIGRILWVNGLAGCGKTTIAYSIAEECDREGILSGSFFCAQSDVYCRDPDLIFVTLCRQLCQYSKPFRDRVVAILEKAPDIVQSRPARQFEELILRPLEELKDDAMFPITVIVIDALDECNDSNTTSTILSVLAKFIDRLPPFLFIITSRPEQHITTMFDKSRKESLAGVTTSLTLHEIQLQSVLDDIRRYMEHEFSEVSSMFRVPKGWPTAQDINTLAQLSHGLWVYATTVIKFVLDKGYSDPEGQLRSLLVTQKHLETSTQEPFLYDLYDRVVTLSYSKISATLSARLRSILGAIVFAEEPLSVPTLAHLLGLSENIIHNSLIGLRSVLSIPDDTSLPIQVIHPTFHEFLLHSSSSKPEAFHIEPSQQHYALFSQCFDVMRVLRYDIAGIENPLSCKTAISGLCEKVDLCMPPHLRYACRYWANHFSNSGSIPNAGNCLEATREFLYHRLLHWLEACSLLEGMEAAIIALDVAQRKCQSLQGPFADLAPFLADCRRFAWTYSSCIDLAPLQVYHSALDVAPTDSLVVQTYTQNRERSLIIQCGALLDWSPTLDAYSGHNGQAVRTVTFSPDGTTFATGGGDGTVKLWRTLTRAMMLCFRGHSDAATVYCVAFSPDGTQVASGSDDGTLLMWNAASGEILLRLDELAEAVGVLSYSTNGTLLSSLYTEEDSGVIRLWDTPGSHYLVTIDVADTDAMAALSPDGAIIAYGDDENVCLHNVASGTREMLPLPSSYELAVFSAGGNFLAVAAESFRIWRLSDRMLAHESHSRSNIRGLAFSQDETRIACGCGDGRVYLWQVGLDDTWRQEHADDSEGYPTVLAGHTLTVWGVAWSPDNSQLVSVSADGTIRVWDGTRRHVGMDRGRDSQDPQTTLSLVGKPCVAVVEIHSSPNRPPDMSVLKLPSLPYDNDFLSSETDFPFYKKVSATFHATLSEAWDRVLRHGQRSYTDVPRWVQTHHWEVVTATQSIYLENDEPIIYSSGEWLAHVHSRPWPSAHLIYVWNLQSGAATVLEDPDGTHKRDPGYTIEPIAFSADGTLLLATEGPGVATIWNVETKELVATRGGTFAKSVRRGSAISFDNNLIACPHSDVPGVWDVLVYDLHSGNMTYTLRPHDELLTRCRFSVDNIYLLSKTISGVIYIWHVPTETCVSCISFKDDSWIHSLHFSADDTGILVTDKDNTTQVVPLWAAGSRDWPVYDVANDGWVWAKGPGFTSSAGWVPPAWRSPISSRGRMLCLYDDERRGVVETDLSQAVDSESSESQSSDSA